LGISAGTPTAKRLSDILQIHIARLDDALGRREEYSKIKPLDLIIITDGEASAFSSKSLHYIPCSGILTSLSGDDPKNVLVKIAAELKPKKHHPNIIGIQFVQIGEDQKARKELRTIARAEVAASTYLYSVCASGLHFLRIWSTLCLTPPS